jgi:hypothetical protein
MVSAALSAIILAICSLLQHVIMESKRTIVRDTLVVRGTMGITHEIGLKRFGRHAALRVASPGGRGKLHVACGKVVAVEQQEFEERVENCAHAWSRGASKWRFIVSPV